MNDVTHNFNINRIESNVENIYNNYYGGSYGSIYKSGSIVL